LDANFFARVAKYRPHRYRDTSGSRLLERVQRTARNLGEPDLVSGGNTLEQYLGQVYFTVQHDPALAGVRDYFTGVDLYAREVIATTEWMIGRRAGRRDDELLRRMLQRELADGRRVAVVTFNIDLVVESTLEILTHSRPGAAWTLRTGYGFGTPLELLTGPGPDFPYADGPSEIPLRCMVRSTGSFGRETTIPARTCSGSLASSTSSPIAISA
jgi:hypothetical protein